MFKLINKIVDPVADTLNAASAVISTSAQAVVEVSQNGAARQGVTQLSGSINHGLLSLNETMKSIAFSACQSNDADFAQAAAQNPNIAKYSSLDEYLSSRMG